MGREIRRVPADWEHPMENGRYHPLFNRPFAQEARKWMDDAIAWDNGTHPDCEKYKASHPFFWQWDGDPPDAEYRRPEWTEEQLKTMHFQMYETVSEGTPVTPHFATKEELVNYLVEFGDDWDQRRTAEGRQGAAGWPREAAEKFVHDEWAPSMIMVGGKILTPRDVCF